MEHGRKATLPGFDPLFGNWITWLRDSEIAEPTISAYANSVAECCVILAEITGRDIDATSISQINPEIPEAMQVRMRQCGRVEMGTISFRMTALRSFADYLHSQCGVRCDSILSARILRDPQTARHVPGVEDRAELIEAAASEPAHSRWEDARDAALLILVSIHALKISQLVELNRAEVELQNALRVVRGGKEQTIDLHHMASGAIAAYIEFCPFDLTAPESPLFVGSKGGRLSTRVAQLVLQRLRQRLGLHNDTKLQTLRRGAIQDMRAAGHSDKEILDLAGLQSVGALFRATKCVHPDPAAMERAAQETRDRMQARKSDRGASARAGDSSVKMPTSKRSSKLALVTDGDLEDYRVGLPHSKSPYIGALRCFVRFLPQGKTLREASAEEAAAFIKFRSESCEASTVAVDYSALSSFYMWLHSAAKIKNNPLLDVPAPSQSNSPRIAASLDIVGEWLEGIERLIASYLIPTYVALRVAVLIRLLALEGIKLGQALGIRSAAVLEDAVVIAGRPAYFSAETNTALLELARAAGMATYIFRGRDSSLPVSPQQARLWLRKMGARLGLDDISPERLTQAYRREFLDASGNLNLLAAQVGLRSAEAVRYAHDG